ncbi:MAG: polysaccharide biosynthesis C-terminal domain-containing protein [Balneolaceae bacterium]
MVKLRELFSDTLIYGISSVLARFVNYLLVPFHTDVFNPARYGVVGLVYAAIAFLNVVFTLGMESAYLRYAKDRDHASSIFKTLQLALLGTSSLLALILWALEPAILPLLSLSGESSGIFLMMIGILWFDTLSIVPFAELRLVRRSLLFAILKVGHVVLNLVLNFWLILGMNLGIEAVFISNLAASMLVTLVIWAVTFPMMRGEWNRSLLSRSFSFGWPFIPAGIGYAVNEMLDRFFLNAMDPGAVVQLYGSAYTPEDIVGIYNACYKLAVFMLLLIQMYRMAWQPFFMRHSDDPDARPLFARAFYGFNLFAAALYLFVGLFTRDIVAIEIPVLNATLIGSSYWMGLNIVPILMLAYWFHGWYINFSAGIFISERTRMLPVITLGGAGITIVANLVLIPLWGMLGAAWATLLSYASMAISLYLYNQRGFEIPYRMKRAFSVMGWAVLLVFLAPWIISWVPVDELVVRVVLMVVGIAPLLGLGWATIREHPADEPTSTK